MERIVQVSQWGVVVFEPAARGVRQASRERPRGSEETVTHRVDRGLGPTLDTELGKDAGEVCGNGATT